jgi:hypothetical protein
MGKVRAEMADKGLPDLKIGGITGTIPNSRRLNEGVVMFYGIRLSC